MEIVVNVIRKICLIGNWGIFSLFAVGLFILGSNVQSEFTERKATHDKCLAAINDNNLCDTNYQCIEKQKTLCKKSLEGKSLSDDKCLEAIYDKNICDTDYQCIENQESLCKKSLEGKPAAISKYYDEWWYPYLQFITPESDIAKIFMTGICFLILGAFVHFLINWVFRPS